MDLSIIEILSGGTIGSIATMLVQKVLSRKKDKIDVSQSQLNFFTEINERLHKSVVELEKKICYIPDCDFRVNGNKKK